MQLLRKIAFPISLVYALVVHMRNFFFDIGLFKENTFSTRTICVGNLSVGGTGKTPMIEYLIEILGNRKKIGVLSRGYKRKSQGYILATEASTITEIGDEPYQIHSKFPEVRVAVDADRCNGMQNLEKAFDLDVVLLDDAFQHRKVAPGYAILLTTYGNLYVDDWYLPTGNLRDSKKEAQRAQLIIVTKCPKDLSEQERETILKKLKPKHGQKVLFASLEYGKDIKGEEKVLTLEELSRKEVTLVTGIANPVPLVSYLESQGLAPNHLKYADHHFFSPSEIETLNSKECILTTEKDYVRLKGKVKNLYYIQIRHHFLGDGHTILNNELKTFMQ